MLTLHRELHSDWAGWIVSGKICLCFFCEHWVRTSPCTREQMPSVLSNCTYWGCTLVSQHDMPAVFLNCCKTAVHRGPCPSYISFSCGGCTACMFLILSRMHWIPQLMCSMTLNWHQQETLNSVLSVWFSTSMLGYFSSHAWCCIYVPPHCHASLQAQHGIWTLFGQVGDIATECFGTMPKSDDARKSLKLNRFR